MKNAIRVALVFAVALAVSAPVGGRAGTIADPNAGDTVLGTVGGVRYASEAATYDAVSGYASATAGCGGPRWHLIGGGSSSNGPASQTWQAASRPEDYTDADTLGDDGWLAGGYGPSSAQITSVSICIQDGARRYPSTTVASSSTGLRSGSVGCGGSKWHVSTGSAFIATTGSWVTSSFPMDGADPNATPDDGWKGSVYDTIGGGGGFYVYAVCVAGMSLRYEKAAPVTLAVGQSVVRRVTCKPGEHVVGGGARVSGPENRSRLLASVPYDGTDAGAIPDDGWRSQVYGISGAAKQVTAFAICLA